MNPLSRIPILNKILLPRKMKTKLTFKRIVQIDDEFQHEVSSLLSTIVDSFYNDMKDFMHFIDEIPAPIKIICFINIFIFLLWKSKPMEYMRSHFTFNINNNNLRKWYTWITSSFSHESITHLSSNLYVLLLFGPSTLEVIGLSWFYGIIGLSSVIYPLITTISNRIKNLFYKNRRYHSNDDKYSLGFSVINSCLAVFHTALNPKDILPNEFAYGFSSLTYLKLAIFSDILGFTFGLFNNTSNIGHLGHLYGFCLGILLQKFICSDYKCRFVSKRCRNAFCEY